MKPKILISSERDDPCAKYTAAILAAGGLPTVAYCPQVSLDYDGLLLSGGGDIAPHLFAAEDQGSQDIDYDRDMAELELFGAFWPWASRCWVSAGAIKSSTWDWGAP